MSKKSETENTPYMVPALERGLRIIELLADNPGGLSMSEMSCLKLPQASLYRLLVTLSELGYVLRDSSDRYRLNRKLLTLGYKAMDQNGLTEIAASPMRRLCRRINETVVLGVISGNEGVAIDTVRSEQPVCVSVKIGHHFPLHTAAPAKAVMAFLPEEELSALLDGITYTKFTERTICNRKTLLAELEKVRKDHIAFDLGEELSDLRCAASPIFDSRHYPVAAVWMTGPESRLNRERLLDMAEEVKLTAEEISSGLL